jgi:HK97 family phage major capsid protein
MRRDADRELATRAEELSHIARARLDAHRDDGPRLDLARLVLDLAGPGPLAGENREALQETARQAGKTFDPDRPLIPFAAFRDLTASAGAGGGFLKSTATSEAADILRPWSVTARAGIQIATGLVGDQVIPKVTGKSTPQWLATEGSEATPSQPTLAQVAMRPKDVGAVIRFSRQLARQANAEAFVRRELMRSIGTAVDQAVLAGSGAAGVPTGLLLTPGVQTQSGTTLQHAGTTAMKRMAAAANVDDERIAFLSTPAVRELLENRLRTGNGTLYVWQDDRVADRPAFVSTDVPSAVMVCGDFGNIYVGVWSEAFVLEVDPYSDFKSARISGRVILACDVAVLHPAGFVKAEAIT